MLHEAADGAALVEDGAHQHAEGDEEANLHHDLAETGRDGFDGLFDAQAYCKTEVDRTDDQGDDGIDSETDNQDHGGKDRHGRVDQDSYV